jgi:hypothetical protein
VAAVPITERGYASTSSAWWQGLAYDADEPVELQWPNSVSIYNRMRKQDAQVTSVLRAVSLPLRRTRWWVDPAGAKVAVSKFIADELGLPLAGRPERPSDRTKDRFSWAEHLRLALLMLPATAFSSRSIGRMLGRIGITCGSSAFGRTTRSAVSRLPEMAGWSQSVSTGILPRMFGSPLIGWLPT